MVWKAMSDRNPELDKLAQEYAARPYCVITYFDTLSNGETVILVENPALYGCMVHGNTVEEALTELALVREDRIYSMLEDGDEIPEPASFFNTVTSERAGKAKIVSK